MVDVSIHQDKVQQLIQEHKLPDLLSQLKYRMAIFKDILEKKETNDFLLMFFPLMSDIFGRQQFVFNAFEAFQVLKHFNISFPYYVAEYSLEECMVLNTIIKELILVKKASNEDFKKLKESTFGNEHYRSFLDSVERKRGKRVRIGKTTKARPSLTESMAKCLNKIIAAYKMEVDKYSKGLDEHKVSRQHLNDFVEATEGLFE